MSIIDIISTIISFFLGIGFGYYLEKKVWPNFNKKHGIENDLNMEDK